MAHQVETMAYAGEVPWHGLGVRVTEGLTPDEMMVEAGLDWEVEKREMFYIDSNGNQKRGGDQTALVRSSDGMFLDTVSDMWNPVQNRDAFNFFDEYTRAGGMEMHTAGSLRDGKVIWALAKVNDSFALFGGKDKVESYLLLSNPHQFGRGVDIRFTPIRVVCNNTLSFSLNRKATLAISLNHRSEFDAEKAREALSEAHQKMTEYKEMSEFLASKKFNESKLFEYFNHVFPRADRGSNSVKHQEMMDAFRNKDKKIVSRNAILAAETLEEQPGAEYGKGTWWQAYNTVTFMTNHLMGRNSDTRMQSLWFGQNKNRNIDALGAAIEFANAA